MCGIEGQSRLSRRRRHRRGSAGGEGVHPGGSGGGGGKTGAGGGRDRRRWRRRREWAVSAAVAGRSPASAGHGGTMVGSSGGSTGGQAGTTGAAGATGPEGEGQHRCGRHDGRPGRSPPALAAQSSAPAAAPRVRPARPGLGGKTGAGLGRDGARRRDGHGHGRRAGPGAWIATCSTGTQCTSGFCVDKVCCNVACTGHVRGVRCRAQPWNLLAGRFGAPARYAAPPCSAPAFALRSAGWSGSAANCVFAGVDGRVAGRRAARAIR